MFVYSALPKELNTTARSLLSQNPQNVYLPKRAALLPMITMIPYYIILCIIPYWLNYMKLHNDCLWMWIQ